MSLYTVFVEINELFSANLVRIRKAKGLSQRELSSKTGISQRMINHYEHNPRSLPVDRLKVLSDALGARISSFFSEDEVTGIDTIDVRWIKKLQDIKSLPEADQKEINRHINSLLQKLEMSREIEKTRDVPQGPTKTEAE